MSRLRRCQSFLRGCLRTSRLLPANGPVNVLLLDYLNTPLISQPYARQTASGLSATSACRDAHRDLRADDAAQMLQGFTSDMLVLKAL